VELRPRIRAGLALYGKAVHGLRLPGGDEGTGRVLEDSHPPNVHHVEWWRDDLAALCLDLLGGGVRVSCADVDHPGGWRVPILLPADAGHVLAGQPGDGVSARVGILLRLGLPAEQLRVVVARPC